MPDENSDDEVDECDDVDAHGGAAGVVARAAEPPGHQSERIVAGEEAGNEEHRLPAAVGNALALEDRVAEQRGDLEPQPALAPERGRKKGRERSHSM